MSKKTPEALAARKLQDDTGASYMTCLNMVRKYASEAAAMKVKNPHLPFVDCLASAARPYLRSQS